MRRTIITDLTSKLSGKTFFLMAVVFTLLSGKCFAQETDKYNFSDLTDLFQHHHHKPPKYESKSEKPKNELEFLMATGFNSYKMFFSSQDNPSCVFHPSCSSYSVQAMQQKGMFIGTLQTFDRLSRCHRFVKTNQYIYDPSKQRFYDPVR